MKPFLPSTGPHSQLEREIERERNQRLKHDDEKSGVPAEDEFRTKDARSNPDSGQRQRQRPR